jgi:hypothetical protein
VALGNVPLREAVALAYRLPGPEGKGVKPAVDVAPNVPDQVVNLVHSHDNERVVVRFIVRQAAAFIRGLGYTEKDGRLAVALVPDQRFGSPEEFKEITAPPLANPERRLVLCFRKAPIRQVLSMVFEDTLPRFGLTFELEIADTAPDTPITLTIVSGNAQQAMDALLAELKKQVPNLEVKREGWRLKVSRANL